MTLNDQHFVQECPITFEELCPHCFNLICECDDLPRFVDVKDEPRPELILQGQAI